MGWLHNFNLKRKVAGVLTAHRGKPQTVAAIARGANADEREVAQLLDAMERSGYAVSSLDGSDAAYQLNEGQGTVGKILHTFEDKQQLEDKGLILRRERHGWTAELADPAGMIVRGHTREEARERGLALMEKMAAPPSETPRNQPDSGSAQA